ncbi:hypothetical protein A3709_02740 [Halioglobus sp. HI00S01]|uniref:glycosyltransferase n=1 Tax=Halioglobus sp. HI00S01 TaxID=1822214 RepID=UPI0007C25673|nr:glycosyltransferase [Halioglobus sp. HI00S01]KZX58396.1 hypothetical protein A3709_02740 [Halioglobus sp. HI00S01]
MYKRIVIIDPNLKDTFGHSYRYVRTLAANYPKSEIFLSAGTKNLSDAGTGVKLLPAVVEDIYDTTKLERISLKHRILRRAEHIYQANVDEFNQKSRPAKAAMFVLRACLMLSKLTISLSEFLGSLFRRHTKFDDDFASSLHKILEPLSLTEHDLVVFQTMLWPQFDSMMELLVLTEKKPYEAHALFVVHDDARTYYSHYNQFPLRKFYQRVQENLPFLKSKILVTSSNLQRVADIEYGARTEVVADVNDKAILANVDRKKGAQSGTKLVFVPGAYRGDKNFSSVLDYAHHLDSLGIPELCLMVHKSVLLQLGPKLAEYSFVTYYETLPSYVEYITLIADADVIFIPYGEEYINRISGILNEAALVGTPCLCWKRIADAVHIKDPIGTFENVETAAKATAQIVNSSYDCSDFYNENSNRTVFEHLECADGWTHFKNKPIAVQSKPSWLRCGSTSIFEAQLQSTLDNDYFVIELFINSGIPFLDDSKLSRWKAEVLRSNRKYVGASIARVIPKSPNLYDLLSYLLQRRRESSLKQRTIKRAWGKIDKPLARFFKQNQVEIEITNHIYNTLMMEKLFTPNRRIIETHDVQARQEKIELGNQVSYQQSLISELQLLERFDVLVNLNHAEHCFFKKLVSTESVFISPYINESSEDTSYETLHRLIKSESHDKTALSPDLKEQYDLIFVGDGHPANVNSLNWFIEEVFRQTENTSLLVVGSIGSKLDISSELNKRIHRVGYLHSLANIYDFALINILPDIDGAGIPIKTHTVISKELCFAATEFAMRGFDLDGLWNVRGKSVAESDYMAADIVALLSDPEVYEQRLETSRKLKVQISKESYESKWSNLIQ